MNWNRMKCRFGVLMLVAAVLPGLSARENLIRAGNFAPNAAVEAGQPGVFQVISTDPEQGAMVYSSNIKVESGELYEFSCTVNARITVPSQQAQYPVNVYVYWFDRDGQPLPGDQRRTSLVVRSRNTDWEKVANAARAPENAAYARLMLGIYRAVAEADYRDLRFVRVSAPEANASDSAAVDVGEPDWSKLTPQAGEILRGTRRSISLGGVWGFRPELANGKSTGFATLNVPGMWGEIIGFDQPQAWRNALRAVYMRKFALPDDWAGQRVALSFGAVSMLAEVTVNGQPVGSHLGAFTSFELDITDAVQPGENVLRVDVTGPELAGQVGGRFMTMMSYPWWGRRPDGPRGGIWQDVTLLCRPPVYSDDHFVKTSYRRGEISAEMLLVNTAAESFAGTLNSYVTASPDELEPVFELAAQPVHILAGQSLALQLSARKWDLPRYWSPEDPHLYYLVSELTDATGRLVDRQITRFGFREFYVEGTDFYLNGQIRRLRGDSVRLGYDWGVLRRDYTELMFRRFREDLHLNAVRYHCFIPPAEILDVADEMGMLLDVQTGLVGGGNQAAFYLSPATRPELMRNLKREFAEWVKRDRNHPSLVIWNLENELFSCCGMPSAPITRELEEVVRGLDDTRIVTRAAAGAFDGDEALFNVHGYDGYFSRLAVNLWEQSPRRPYLNSEFWANHLPQVAHGDRAYADTDFTIESYGYELAEWIEYQRARGAAGLYPFELSQYVYDHVHQGDQRLAWPSAVSGEWRMEKTGRYKIPVGSTDQFNPGWVADSPEAKPHPTSMRSLSRAMRPLAVVLRDPYHTVYSGDTYRNIAVLINDTQQPVTGTLRVALERLGAEGSLPLYEIPTGQLQPGDRQAFPLNLTMPEVTGATVARLKLTVEAEGNIIADNDLAVTIYPPVKLRNATGKTIFLLGGDLRQQEILERLGIAHTALIDGEWQTGDLLIVAESAPLDEYTGYRDRIRQYLEKGGRVLVLRQESDISKLLPGRVSNVSSRTPKKFPFIHMENFPPMTGSKLRFNHATHPGHPVWNGLAEPRLYNWRNSDLCVSAGSFNQNGILGRYRELAYAAAGYNQVNSTLIEYFSGPGRFLATQIELMANAGAEPEADLMLVNLVSYLLDEPYDPAGEMGLINADNRIPGREIRPAVVGAGAIQAWSTSPARFNRFASVAEVSGAVAVFVSPDALTTPEALQAAEALAQNGARVYLAYASDSQALFDRYGMQTRPVNARHVRLPQEKAPYLRGLNGFDFTLPNHQTYPFGLRPVQGWTPTAELIAVQRGWEYPYHDNPRGVFIMEKAFGKGKLILVPWHLFSEESERRPRLLQAFQSALGADFESLELEIPQVRILRAGQITLDGDLREWNYDKEVEEQVDYRHADPIVLAWNLSEVTGNTAPDHRNLSAVVYFLYDTTYLYFAAQVVDDRVVFNRRNPLLHDADSLDFFIEGAQLISARVDGRGYIGIVKAEELGDAAEVVIVEHSNVGGMTDMHLIGPGLEGAPGYLIEGRVKLAKLFPDGKIPQTFRLAVGVNDADSETGGRERQYYFPKGYRHKQPATFAEATLAP